MSSLPHIGICVTPLQESYDSSSLWFILVQEEIEPTVVCRQGLSDNAGEKLKLTENNENNLDAASVG